MPLRHVWTKERERPKVNDGILSCSLQSVVLQSTLPRLDCLLPSILRAIIDFVGKSGEGERERERGRARVYSLALACSER